MFVSQVILSGITLEPRVDQLLMIKVALADSNMMTQLCRYGWEVQKNFSSAHNYWPHLSNPIQRGNA
jgi:hypothetical protein